MDIPLIRRLSVIIISTLAALLALGLSIFLILNIQRKRNTQTAKIQWIGLLFSLSLLIHAIFAITVTIDMHYGIFNVITLGNLVVSCAFSLVYSLFMSYMVQLRFKAMKLTRYQHLCVLYLVLQLLFKTTSFILVFYIAGSHPNPDNLLNLYLTPLGNLASILNLVGNVLHGLFITVCTVYFVYYTANVIMGKVDQKSHHSTGSQQRKNAMESAMQLQTDMDVVLFLRYQTQIFTTSTIILSLLAVIFAILSFGVVQHAVGIAMNALTSVCLVILTFWLDQKYKLAFTAVHKLSNAQPVIDQ
jgi:hypothetical protein